MIIPANHHDNKRSRGEWRERLGAVDIHIPYLWGAQELLKVSQPHDGRWMWLKMWHASNSG